MSSRSEVFFAQRGTIFDRNRNPLVTNIDKFVISVIPAMTSPVTTKILSERLTEIIGKPANDILDRLSAYWANDWNPIVIADEVPYSVILQLAESIEDFPGVTWFSRPS